MGYSISIEQSNALFQSLSDKYDIYAPKVFEGEGCFSDTDSLRYGKVKSFDEILFERKSELLNKEKIDKSSYKYDDLVKETEKLLLENKILKNKRNIKKRNGR